MLSLLIQRLFSTRTKEVERKFKPTAKILANLSLSQKNVKTSNKSFTDCYFDTSNFVLTKQDMWLRKRNDILELKYPSSVAMSVASNPSLQNTSKEKLIGIDFYEEETDVATISDLIKRATNGKVEKYPSQSLLQFAAITTNRSRYFIDVNGNQFYVDIDNCDFHTRSSSSYSIGEIEIKSLRDNGAANESQAIEEAFEYLEIEPQPVRGKVLEFLFRHSSNHYQSLIDSGLITKKMGVNGGDDELNRPSDRGPSRLVLNGHAVNMHFTRKCNYSCKFCFHTQTNTNILPIEDQKKIIKILRGGGADKLNFAGGEPFIYPDMLGKLCQFAKQEGFSNVSIITNASLISNKNNIRHTFFGKYGEYIDVIGVSCDTVNKMTNFNHGRYPKNGSNLNQDGETPMPVKFSSKINQIDNVRFTAELCKEFNINFKINTVVTKLNVDEDISSLINELNPVRWKVFQVLAVDGENNGSSSINDVSPLLINDDEFRKYVERNKSLLNNPSIMECEDNNTMRDSYILIDENGCFLNTANGGKIPTQSILKVGLESAMDQFYSFNKNAYDKRNGDWYKSCR